MKLARTQRTLQRGMVVGLLIALLLLGGALFAFTSLNVASVRVDRDRDTNEALAQAKDALIAYAVTDLTRPGQLPCPDVNNDGEAKSGEDFNAATGVCISLIGRLPWVTLGLPDLRDDTGERLWYAVSGDFRTDNTIPPAVPLNSDTAYRGANVSLQLIGITPATNLAAIVFSPGGALLRSDGVSQTRGCTGGAGAGCDANLKCTSVLASNTDKCNAVNYLDLTAGEDNANLANRIFVSATRSDSFNDRPMPIFPDDIMRLVERRAARELAQRLRDHYDRWDAPPAVGGINYTNFKGFYPWAAPFNDPTVMAAGVSTTTAGQLPLSSSSVVWNSAGWPLGGCAGVNTNEITCTGLLALPLLLTINGTVRNVGTAFIDPPNVAVEVLSGGAGGTITWNLVPGTQTLNFTFTGIGLGLPLTIRVRAPEASAWTTSSWLVTNNWHQNAFYALSPGYALNGVDNCGGAAPSCITIANTAAPNDDKHAVVMMTGRALPLVLPSQTLRPIATPPSAPLAQFFEGANATLDLIFQSDARTATFNDTAIAVRP